MDTGENTHIYIYVYMYIYIYTYLLHVYCFFKGVSRERHERHNGVPGLHFAVLNAPATLIRPRAELDLGDKLVQWDGSQAPSRATQPSVNWKTKCSIHPNLFKTYHISLSINIYRSRSVQTHIDICILYRHIFFPNYSHANQLL